MKIWSKPPKNGKRELGRKNVIFPVFTVFPGEMGGLLILRLCVCIIFDSLFSSASRPKWKQLCTLMRSSTARSHQWLTRRTHTYFQCTETRDEHKGMKKKRIVCVFFLHLWRFSSFRFVVVLCVAVLSACMRDECVFYCDSYTFMCPSLSVLPFSLYIQAPMFYRPNYHRHKQRKRELDTLHCWFFFQGSQNFQSEIRTSYWERNDFCTNLHIQAQWWPEEDQPNNDGIGSYS